VRPEILSLADSIAQEGQVQDGLIGIMPDIHVSRQFLRFVHLADSSTTPELIRLAEHASPAVRYYSLQALSYRKDAAVLPCLRSHLSDTVEVSRLGFDILTVRPISHVVADEFFKRYCTRTPVEKLDYLDIRGLAADSVVPSAVIALARFRKPGDVPLLQRRIRQLIFVQQVKPNGATPFYPLYGLAAIRELPDSRFFPILEESVNDFVASYPSLTRMLFQAIVQFPCDSAARLLERAIAYADRYDHYLTQVNLAMALIKYPDQCFRDRFANRIDLDFRSIVSWHQRESEEL
jgi:hypothetical protein